jgi:hypothetical protein
MYALIYEAAIHRRLCTLAGHQLMAIGSRKYRTRKPLNYSPLRLG